MAGELETDGCAPRVAGSTRAIASDSSWSGAGFRRLAAVPVHAVALNLASSVVRKRTEGVTVLPSAEGRSLRSDPRWTRDGARRADRLLQRLVSRRRAGAAART